MKVAVLSDTHLMWGRDKTGGWRGVAERVLYGGKRTKESKFAEVAERYCSGVDLIIHAGDLIAPGLLDFLGKFAEVEAVAGNLDRGVDLPGKKILQLEGHTIGLTHGRGAPRGIIGRVQAEFKNDNPEMIIFGHSHRPLDEVQDGVRFFNPGSPTDRVFAPYRSLGLLEIGTEIQAEIIKL